MKLTFGREELVKAATVTQSLVNPQTSLPVLSNVLVEAEGDRCVFVATDLEASVRCSVPAKVDVAGRVTVPAKTFSELARELPNAEIHMELAGDLLEIHAEGANYHLQTMPPEDFPSWPQLDPKATLTIGQGELGLMLGRVIFAIPARDPRKVLLGALFDVQSGQLSLIATDGKKMGFTRREVVDCHGESEITAIVPHKILVELQRALGSEGEVRVMIAERQVAFDMGDVIFLSNKIDGTFPNYSMVIPAPEDIQREVRFDRDEFAAVIRRASIISEEKNNSIIIRVAPRKARITARTYDVGDFEGDLIVDYEGEPFDIAFNHKYLTEIMRIMEDKAATMKIKQTKSPVLFVNESDLNTIYLVMPIKLSDLADLGEDTRDGEDGND